MNIYVETNFVLELVLEQEQCGSCEEILQLCEAGRAELIVPAYSFAESLEKLHRQAKQREGLQRSLNDQLGQLSRTASYESRIKSIQDIATLIVQSNEEERQRFSQYRQRLLQIAGIIPLTADILGGAATCETTYSLEPQDAIIYASIVSHLNRYQPQQACFLSRDPKAFSQPDIRTALDQLRCRVISRFDSGLSFLRSQLRS